MLCIPSLTDRKQTLCVAAIGNRGFSDMTLGRVQQCHAFVNL